MEKELSQYLLKMLWKQKTKQNIKTKLICEQKAKSITEGFAAYRS